MTTLPKLVLLRPAMLALKALQARCLGSAKFDSVIFTSQLDLSGKSLCDVCQALRKHEYRYEDILLLNDNMLLDEHIRDISERLTDEALFKLALLTWHFDASSELPSRELLLFFEHPNREFMELCEDLCRQYSGQTGKCVLNRDFAKSFADMLRMLESFFENGWSVVWQCLP